MPPSTMSSTSNVILFPGRRFGPSDRKPRRIGAARLLRHDRQLGVHQLLPGGAKLTKPCDELPTTEVRHRPDWIVGQPVRAKWSENGRYYPATLVKVRGRKATVRWDEDS